MSKIWVTRILVPERQVVKRVAQKSIICDFNIIFAKGEAYTLGIEVFFGLRQSTDHSSTYRIDAAKFAALSE